ncbi:phosphoglucosamine mutase [Pelagirhabdus alkalitolerans]|uniref:Phosphoglucosamine mutase n=1 Tax=Pelagirhabdus alkalitolerans TaxID=1612202 RepID=A0A1G6K1C5_9BACI|nr:phosphoglucosamine mutase [Pelagirhabdus alkalitolerans]SDC24435.1 phosphoglucosamine mutase [Pelagirhabdus alkalitolerans]
MGKYFGTDGVRGIANKELTPELAFKLGRFGGYVLTNQADKPKVLIGKDTRISGEMLESALIAGLLSTGAEVMRLGVITTPGVAYLTKAMSAQAGAMISASHNPVEDNGIKFFGSDGFKLTDAQEEEIEALIDAKEDTLPRPAGSGIGQITDYFEGGQKYIQYLKQSVDNDFEDLHIALDCANGSASPLATHLFADLEADISTIGTSPDGLNINDGVGSTHPEKLQAYVIEKEANIGLAFDGDGDRLIAVDELGRIVDGDQIMYICAKHFNDRGLLRHSTVVSTVMSNLGFYKAIEENGMKSDKTDVGDRYVMEEMRRGGYNLGGEQSGHIIFLDYNTTGDGMLTALQLINVMKETGRKLSDLADEMVKFPQVLKNVRVVDKYKALVDERIQEIITKVENEMGDEGRVLVRPSGTESLVRVMVEAPTVDRCNEAADQVVNVIDELLGMK